MKNKNLPLVIQLFPNQDLLNLNKEQLLFLNFTKDYYYGHCDKFYTYSTSTFLIEPNTTLEVELTNNQTLKKLGPEVAEKYRKLGAKVLPNNTIVESQKTEIKFLGENTVQNEYFQTTFDLKDKIDNRLDLYKNKPIENAIVSLKKIKQKLLDNLEAEEKTLSPTFYEYVKTEIEFGARLEFIKFLMLTKTSEHFNPDSLFKNEISAELLDIIEFDKDNINPVIIASENYNKYLELYLNFKINVQNKKYIIYNEFSKQKCKSAIRELPEKSNYFYIANQLLYKIRTDDFVEDLVVATIKKFPEGELNDKLMEKYDL
ncbi:hypothetical protein [Chondrinema litorale]|uniref:hypothetical protein n=1 Tax=Chondrinema litorale TaxID=2994555 RepID=UPI0025431E06|nr:hypothetical protein [Chondrinema litorale]UZR96408.1 hypothetical protein OQ292_22385 [Chondrinema litorale]